MVEKTAKSKAKKTAKKAPKRKRNAPPGKKIEGSKATNPFEPTDAHREQVYLLAQQGLGHRHILPHIKDANGKPIALDTFKKYFIDDYERGHSDVMSKCSAALVQKITAQRGLDMAGVKACELFMKWKGEALDVVDVSLSGKKDGEPIKTKDVTRADRAFAGVLQKLTRDKKDNSGEEV